MSAIVGVTDRSDFGVCEGGDGDLVMSLEATLN
jgi:hypothetical protein